MGHMMKVVGRLLFLSCQTRTIAMRQSDEERAIMGERAADPPPDTDLTVINHNVTHGFRCDDSRLL